MGFLMVVVVSFLTFTVIPNKKVLINLLYENCLKHVCLFHLLLDH